MKSIEEIKIELTLKKLSGRLGLTDIECSSLPKNDELRTFVCSLGARFSIYYAEYVDMCPHDETRSGACRSSYQALNYAMDVDRCATPETRESAYKRIAYKSIYQQEFGD